MVVAVEIPPAETVDIGLLKVDQQNPNRMTEKQRLALRESIVQFGFIVPIITNKDYLIADGEQRYTVAKEDLLMEQVPVVRLPLEDVDRRILRQVLNKLKGEHELLGDALEFQRILAQDGGDRLKELINISEAQFQKTIAEIERVDKELLKPDKFEEVTELDTEHVCPKCGYKW